MSDIDDIEIRKKRTDSKRIDTWDMEKQTDITSYDVDNIQHKDGIRVLRGIKMKLVEETSDTNPDEKQLKVFYRITGFDPLTIEEYGDDPVSQATKLIVKLIKESRNLSRCDARGKLSRARWERFYKETCSKYDI